MIIGINGYIGSGKDTVGKIIQYLMVNKIHNNFTDKNWTIEQFKSGTLDNALGQSGWQIKKFASKLKQVASLLTGIPVEKFEDQDFKKTFLGHEWDYDERRFRSRKTTRNQMTVREFLQRLGTEAIRTGLHTNAWVNGLFSEYKPNEDPDSKWPNWVVTDTRFPNEAQAIIDAGGIVVRINRMKTSELSEEGKVLHPSETSLDDWKFNYIINNNDTIEELVEEVRVFLNTFQLL
jgi:hypothetical protein